MRASSSDAIQQFFKFHCNQPSIRDMKERHRDTAHYSEMVVELGEICMQ